MTDQSPAATPSAAVASLVRHFTSQLERATAGSKAQQAQLSAIAKQTKDAELRKAINDTVKQQAAAAAEAAAVAKQIQAATNPMTADLETLIAVASKPF